MGFLPPAPPPHICDTPPIKPFLRRALPQGTRWQCDECQEVWVIRPIAARPVVGFWARENPKPPKAPSGAGGNPTRLLQRQPGS
jgi:hypothetical protein